MVNVLQKMLTEKFSYRNKPFLTLNEESERLSTKEDRVRFRGNSCGSCNGQRGRGTDC